MIRVYLIDDSATVRKLLTDLLSAQPGIEVIGAAANPLFAWRKMEKDWPDVIVSDIEMPQMDGISFLKKLMKERPTPVVICSSIAVEGGSKAIEAMACGAVEVLHKPKMKVGDYLKQAGRQFSDAVRGAANANVRAVRPVNNRKITSALKPQNKNSADAVLTRKQTTKVPVTNTLIAIGCSTGGTQALEAILPKLPPTVPAILIVQHMPEGFTAAFAKRLNGLSQIVVKEAEHGDKPQPGHAYISPGDHHLLLSRVVDQYQLQLKNGPLVSRHKPSVDVLFRSVAQSAGKNATAFLLTGMGKDGAKGLLELRQANATTYAQNQETSVVFGMPGAAIAMGAAQYEIALGSIAASIVDLVP